MSVKKLVKSVLFPEGSHTRRIVGGALKGMYFGFDLRHDTQAWRGVYEVAFQEWLVKNVRPGAVCLDIGAAQGYFALLMAKLAGPEGTVYAFEPSGCYESIQRNFDLNAATPLAPLKVCHTFVGKDEQSDSATTIDALVQREQLSRVDVVKVDVDGAEVEVLEGMAETLRTFHPHLCVEVHSKELLTQVEEITAVLGYRMQLAHPPAYEVRPIEFNVFLFS